MKVPFSWLSEYCDTGLEPAELAERMAMTGTEVERVSTIGPAVADGFVIGKVLSVEAHPDADRLTVCRVDTGDGEPRAIVCGAPNVEADQTVAVALPGAVLPDGTKLKKTKLRGVASDGMILSEAELQMSEEAAGILVLEGGVEAGTPLGEALPLAEPVLELEVTTNRPDCLGVYGVAREAHAVTEAELAAEPWADDAEATGKGKVEDLASVTVEVPELCPRFTARVFTDVTIGPSPSWLRARLIAAGQKPINNVVDITNYVMWMTAQPLHAFDLDKVPGGALTIRSSKPGEKLTTLDDVERELPADTVLVCDDNGPSAIAGIMGGETSEISNSTTSVLLEVANWDGVNILRTSKQLGLRSEASNRFEKQLHPELTMRAQHIASRLMVELCGAKLVPGTIDVAAEVPEHHKLTLRVPKVESLLGLEIDAETCATYLGRLGFGVEPGDGELSVEVPGDRHYDVTREVDLIEEVARIHNLDENLPSTLPDTAGQVGGLSRAQALTRRAEDVVRDLGFNEIVGWSFTDPGEAGRLRLPADDPRAKPIALSNPQSAEQSVMRTTLLGSLLNVAAYNRARHPEPLALFESGRVYLPDKVPSEGGPPAGQFLGERPAPYHEPLKLGCLTLTEGSEDPDATGFFELKGVAEAVAGQLGTTLELEAEAQPFLHPGRAAQVLVDGEPAGWLGELHPLVTRTWGLEGAVAFELGYGELLGAATAGEEAYEDVTTYPAVFQDLAVVVADEVSAAAVREAVLAGGGELLGSARVFDLYRGEQLGEGRKSLALRLEFRAPDRTLTDEEVAEQREAIKAEIEKLGGALRE